MKSNIVVVKEKGIALVFARNRRDKAFSTPHVPYSQF